MWIIWLYAVVYWYPMIFPLLMVRATTIITPSLVIWTAEFALPQLRCFRRFSRQTQGWSRRRGEDLNLSSVIGSNVMACASARSLLWFRCEVTAFLPSVFPAEQQMVLTSGADARVEAGQSLEANFRRIATLRRLRDFFDNLCIYDIWIHLTFFMTELHLIPVLLGGGWPCDQASIGDDCWSHYGELDQHVSRQAAPAVRSILTLPTPVC